MSSFTFGQPASSGSSTPSTAAPASLFGASTAKSPFSSLTPASTSSTTTPAAASGGSIFGATTSSTGTTSLFGNLPKPAGSGTTAPSLFGAKPDSGSASATTSSTAPAAPSLFGNVGSSFGATSATSSGAATPSLFGQNTAPSTSAPSLFGNATSTTAQPTTSLFSPAADSALKTPAKPFAGFQSTTPSGAPPTNIAKPANLFGGTNATASSSQAASQGTPALLAGIPGNALFGSGPTGGPSGLGPSKQPPSTGFATTGADRSSALTSSFPSFGSNNATTASSAPAPNPLSSILNPASTSASTLGTTSTAATTTATPFASLASATPATTAAPALFGNLSTTSVAPPATSTTATSSSLSLFGGAANTPATTTASAPSLFGNTSSTTASSAPATTTSASAPTPSLFGAPASTTAPSTTATTTTTTAPASTGTANAFSSLGGGAAATPAVAAAAPSTSSTGNLAASTSGPQSSMPRLKNKTMDEIITRWATDLSKYQKEFKEQATKVAAWDRVLVENGEKIQKLYSAAYEADRESNEIERQLANIESNQEELEEWLKRYEDEVAEMYSKQVGSADSLSGPDQERERTYKLAESLNERMDEMGKDLGGMIKEINDVSGSLNKGGKPDDPLSQIVRVLNGHLKQLQWIDSNAVQLQGKVNAAKKASNGLGHARIGSETSAADSFYRSYTGRR